MKRSLILSFVLIFTIIFAGIAAASDCQPTYPPNVFKGNVYYNGSLLSGTYTLNALLGNEKVGQVEFTNGVYSNLYVSSCYGNMAGEIKFLVYNETANEVYSVDGEIGGSFSLNLTINSLPPKESPCGNGNIEIGEECDGLNLAGRTSCLTGYKGTISCSSTCDIDYSNCTKIEETPTSTGTSSSSGGSGGSGGGGGSSGGSGGAVVTSIAVSNNTEPSESSNPIEESTATESKNSRGFITGAFVGIGSFAGHYWWIILVVVVLVGAYFFTKSKLKKKEEIVE